MRKQSFFSLKVIFTKDNVKKIFEVKSQTLTRVFEDTYREPKGIGTP